MGILLKYKQSSRVNRISFTDFARWLGPCVLVALLGLPASAWLAGPILSHGRDRRCDCERRWCWRQRLKGDVDVISAGWEELGNHRTAQGSIGTLRGSPGAGHQGHCSLVIGRTLCQPFDSPP